MTWPRRLRASSISVKIGGVGHTGERRQLPERQMHFGDRAACADVARLGEESRIEFHGIDQVEKRPARVRSATEWDRLLTSAGFEAIAWHGGGARGCVRGPAPCA